MPNIASLLKSEISRVARKEVREETRSLKKAAASHRADIAALKRRVHTLEQELRRVARLGAKPTPPVPLAETAQSFRYSAKSLASQRRRLGITAVDCGRLLGASSLSVYKWESGQARPRAKFIAAIAGLRTLGRKEAAARLEALKQGG